MSYTGCSMCHGDHDVDSACPPVKREATERSHAFPARYPGRCPECKEYIEVGDLIVMDDGRAVHQECAS